MRTRLSHRIVASEGHIEIMDIMVETSHVNPYAPSRHCSDPPLESPASLSRFGTVRVVLGTIAGVVISGSVFGAIAATFIGLVDLRILELAALIPIGMLMGAMVAGFFSLPITFVVFCLCLFRVSPSQGWNLHETRWFAGFCGFFSGLLSFAIVFGPSIVSLVIGMVPAAFGCLGTILVSNWIVRPRRGTTLVTSQSPIGPTTATRTLADRSQQNVT